MILWLSALLKKVHDCNNELSALGINAMLLCLRLDINNFIMCMNNYQTFFF